MLHLRLAKFVLGNLGCLCCLRPIWQRSPQRLAHEIDRKPRPQLVSKRKSQPAWCRLCTRWVWLRCLREIHNRKCRVICRPCADSCSLARRLAVNCRTVRQCRPLVIPDGCSSVGLRSGKPTGPVPAISHKPVRMKLNRSTTQGATIQTPRQIRSGRSGWTICPKLPASPCHAPMWAGVKSPCSNRLVPLRKTARANPDYSSIIPARSASKGRTTGSLAGAAGWCHSTTYAKPLNGIGIIHATTRRRVPAFAVVSGVARRISN